MSNVAVKIDIDNFIKQLTADQRNELARKIWANEMDNLTSIMKKDIKQRRLSPEKINNIIEKNRQEFHEESHS